MELNITCRQGQNAEMYATGYLRNHVSSRFRPSDWKPPLNRPPQPQKTRGALETFWRAIKKMRTAPANVCHWILANRARVSNAPDCPATRLRLGPRRDRVAKRPNTGRTTARANVKGRHLLSGFVGPVQRRSAHDPRRRIQERRGGALFREFVQNGRVQTKAGLLFSPVGTP